MNGQLFWGKLRLITGIVLALYVVQHLINHAFGIVSIEMAEIYRKTVGGVFQTTPGLILLYGSFLLHALNALRFIYRRSSLHMSAWQWLQLLLGLSILPLVAGHMVSNRGFALLGDVDPNYYYVTTSLLLKPVIIVKLCTLILVIWIHLAIGLHFWLRLQSAYPRFLPYTYALIVLIPALAYAGIYRMLVQASGWVDDPQRLDQIYAANIAMPHADVRFLQGLEARAWIVMAVLLCAVLIARQIRLWLQARRGSFHISGADASDLRALTGLSLLEALNRARIPHAQVCGGRARCTTCRVRIGSGLDQLPPPEELESRALKRIHAAADVRLACQLYPRADLSITPLVQPGQSVSASLHSGGVQGHEEYVVAMFVDMRDSTRLGERVLAYDVVFILNRLFTELSAALQVTHGHYAQFAGDGLMALYGLDPARKAEACRDALAGAGEMLRRVERLNRTLHSEFGEQIRIGIGIHGGDAIVGTMGPPKTPLLTAVGDNINIAARLEAQTKTLDCDLIVSVETLDAAGIEYPADRVWQVDVRGRDKQVRACVFDRDQIPGVEARGSKPG